MLHSNGSFPLPTSDSDSDRIWIPNPVATQYYAEHVSTDSDSDSDPFPIVSA